MKVLYQCHDNHGWQCVVRAGDLVIGYAYDIAIDDCRWFARLVRAK